MNQKTKQKLNDAGYTFEILEYGIDVFKESRAGIKVIVFHGSEIMIIHWLDKNGEW